MKRRLESFSDDTLDLEGLTIISADFRWRSPFRNTARLRIQYVEGDADEPENARTAILYGESAINAYQAMSERGVTI